MVKFRSGRACLRRRRWCHKSGRGVSDIVATILLVAITVVLAAVLYIVVRNYLNSTASLPPLEGALALGIPQEEISQSSLLTACSAAPCNFYNLSVQETSRNLQLHDLFLEIVAANGATIQPAGGLVVINPTGGILGQAGFGGSWTSGGTVPVTSSLTFVVYTSGAAPTSLSGDYLQFNGVSAYSGMVTVHVP